LKHTPHNRLCHTIKVTEDLIIRKAQNAIAFSSNHAIANSIVRMLSFISVMTSVELDHNLRSMLGEIREIALDRNLAAEMESISVGFAQLPP
jgi:hypothetical protein